MGLVGFFTLSMDDLSLERESINSCPVINTDFIRSCVRMIDTAMIPRRYSLNNNMKCKVDGPQTEVGSVGTNTQTEVGSSRGSDEK